MPTLNEQVLAHVQCTHAALEVAKTEMDRARTQNEKVAALIPQVVEALVRHERIEPGQREKAAALLADPVAALELLINTADVSKTTKPAAIGGPVEKAASVTGRARFAGERTGVPGQAEENFRRAFLGQ